MPFGIASCSFAPASSQTWLKKSASHVIISRKRENVVDAVRAVTNGQGVDRVLEIDLGQNLEADNAMLKVVFPQPRRYRMGVNPQ
jgi:NADPH:quinone reductase-like Zn-dependent oxidoreductase